MAFNPIALRKAKMDAILAFLSAIWLMGPKVKFTPHFNSADCVT